MPRPCTYRDDDPHTELRPGCPQCELYRSNPKVAAVWDRPDTGRPQKGNRIDERVVEKGITIRVQCRNCRRRKEWAWVVLLDGVPQESGQESTEAAARAAAEAEAQALMAAQQATR